jgi:hypothetical protein
MPQKLGDHIATALERAAAAEQRAREVINPELRLENKRMAESWRLLARGFQYVERLEQQTAQQRNIRRPKPPKKHPWE